jgi:hypothetical protein
MVKKRKTRSDRTHIIYQAVCTATGECYVGVTAKTQPTVAKSLWTRWRKHLQRAHTEGKNWTLCKAIRKYGADGFEVYILETVRGKAVAHERERMLTEELGATLNTL